MTWQKDKTAPLLMTSAAWVVSLQLYRLISTMHAAFSHQALPTARVWSSLPNLRHAVPHQLHTCEHRRPVAPVHGILDRLFGNSSTHDGPELVAIDPDSDGGLGGTRDGLFGPLVRLLLSSRNNSHRFYCVDLQLTAHLLCRPCC